MRRRLVVLAALAASVSHGAAAPSLSAQEPVRVSGEVTCDDCVITLDTILTIGGLEGPGLHVVSYFSLAAVDRRGRVLVMDPTQPDFSVFDSTGAFVRSVGRFGGGPGEYESLSLIDVGPRYIHVFDYEKSRTLLDHDFEVVRVDRLPANVFRAAMVDPDGLWIVWQTPDPEWTDRRSQGGLPTEPWDRILDGWIDLVDPDTGATLARHRTDGILLGFAQGSRYVLGYHETEAGVPYLHLLRPELSTRDNR